MFLFKAKLNTYEKLYISILVSLIIFSLFFSLPSIHSNIGISSKILDIGDRNFYINNSTLGYGYVNYTGNFLYPYILKGITFVSRLFGANQYSYIWNSLTILITLLLSITTLHLIRLSSVILFDDKVANLASLIYILNPYSYFYPLSGGINTYMTFGVTIVFYLFCKLNGNSLRIKKKKNLSIIIFITTGCMFLSSLRPTGSLFSFTILFLLLYKYLKEFIKYRYNKELKIVSILIISAGIIFVFYNFNSVLGYSIDNLKIFSSEAGSYFGYPRDYLREKLILMQEGLIGNIKSLIYTIIWKLTDFISGISDIRDTFTMASSNKLFLFFVRITTGIFILFPLNLFSLIAIFIHRRFIIRSQIWIVILACLVGISPSLIGIANSRYLLHFYTPFLVFASKLLSDIIDIDKKVNS